METQKCMQEELKNMHKNRSKDTKRSEKENEGNFLHLCSKTTLNGTKTPDLVREWPYLFEMCNMMAHLKALTGMEVDRGVVSSKYVRVISYLVP